MKPLLLPKPNSTDRPRASYTIGVTYQGKRYRLPVIHDLHWHVPTSRYDAGWYGPHDAGGRSVIAALKNPDNDSLCVVQRSVLDGEIKRCEGYVGLFRYSDLAFDEWNFTLRISERLAGFKAR